MGDILTCLNNNSSLYEYKRTKCHRCRSAYGLLLELLFCWLMACVSSLLLMLFFFVFQNFVGLSVSDGYIATGSETNEVKLNWIDSTDNCFSFGDNRNCSFTELSGKLVFPQNAKSRHLIVWTSVGD